VLWINNAMTIHQEAYRLNQMGGGGGGGGGQCRLFCADLLC
jgi:hypothetical protein